MKKSKIKSFISSITTLLFVLLALYAVIGVYNQNKTGELFFFFGYRPVVIMSGSMESELQTGAVVLTKETKDVKKDDIIFFKGGEVPVIHRLVRVDGDNYYTKGDSNKKEDFEPVQKEDIYGKVILKCNFVSKFVRLFIE